MGNLDSLPTLPRDNGELHIRIVEHGKNLAGALGGVIGLGQKLFHLAGQGAVSYTHLLYPAVDVIPCARVRGSLKYRCIVIIPAGFKKILIYSQAVPVPEPVSYTHLDVYKRQVHGYPSGLEIRPVCIGIREYIRGGIAVLY